MIEPLDRSRRDSTPFQFTTEQLRDFIDPNHPLVRVDGTGLRQVGGALGGLLLSRSLPTGWECHGPWCGGIMKMRASPRSGVDGPAGRAPAA